MEKDFMELLDNSFLSERNWLEILFNIVDEEEVV